MTKVVSKKVSKTAVNKAVNEYLQANEQIKELNLQKKLAQELVDEYASSNRAMFKDGKLILNEGVLSIDKAIAKFEGRADDIKAFTHNLPDAYLNIKPKLADIQKARESDPDIKELLDNMPIAIVQGSKIGIKKK